MINFLCNGNAVHDYRQKTVNMKGCIVIKTQNIHMKDLYCLARLGKQLVVVFVHNLGTHILDPVHLRGFRHCYFF